MVGPWRHNTATNEGIYMDAVFKPTRIVIITLTGEDNLETRVERAYGRLGLGFSPGNGVVALAGGPQTYPEDGKG
jgi:hypothetical protein